VAAVARNTKIDAHGLIGLCIAVPFCLPFLISSLVHVPVADHVAILSGDLENFSRRILRCGAWGGAEKVNVMANNFDNPFSANVIGLRDFRDGYNTTVNSGLGDGIAQDGTPANGPTFAGGWMLGNGDGSRLDVNDGDDQIDLAYTGDPEGDLTDNGDAINPADEPKDDVVNAGAGDDTVDARAGDDTVHGGSGSDVLNGGECDDVI